MTERASSLAWSSDGRWLAAGQDPGDVLVWDVEHRSRPPLHIKRPRPVPINKAFAYLPAPVVFPAVVYAGGDRFAIIEASGYAEVWSAVSARRVRTFSTGAPTAVASDPTGTVLAVGSGRGTVTLSSLRDGRPPQALAEHSAAVNGITFSADGQLVASVGDDNAVNVTNLVSRRFLGRLSGHTGPVTAAAFTKDDRNLYTSSTDGTLIGWDIANLNNLGSQLSPPGSGAVTWMAASRTGEIAMEYANGSVRFWRGTGAAPTRPIHVSAHELIGGAFSPDGRLFATGDSDGTAGLIDVRSQRIITVTRLPGPAHGVAFSPDGRRIAWTDDDGLLYYFDAASLRQTGRAQFIVSHPRQVVWSPDSRHVAVVGAAHDPDGPVVIVVYSASTGIEDWRAPAFDGLAWSPDGTTIATGGDAATGIQLLRASDGTVVGGGWKDHAKTYTVAYSPDGSLIASTGLDGSVVLRDAATGEQIGPALTSSYNQQASIVRFDAAGRLIVSTADGGLWRWTIDLPHLLHQACAIAGRNLTTQEWADLHTGRPYLAACD